MTKAKTRRAAHFAAFLALAGMLFALAAPHAVAANEKQSYTANRTYQNADNGNVYTDIIQETVTYQVGSNTITVEKIETEIIHYAEYAEDLEQDIWRTTDTYTLSQPLQAAARQGEWNVVFDVPEGTTVTCVSSYKNTFHNLFMGDLEADGKGTKELVWYQAQHIFTPDEDLPLYAGVSDYPLEEGSGARLTVAKGAQYQMLIQDEYETETNLAAGGVVFRGV